MLWLCSDYVLFSVWGTITFFAFDFVIGFRREGWGTWRTTAGDREGDGGDWGGGLVFFLA